MLSSSAIASADGRGASAAMVTAPGMMAASKQQSSRTRAVVQDMKLLWGFSVRGEYSESPDAVAACHSTAWMGHCTVHQRLSPVVVSGSVFT